MDELKMGFVRLAMVLFVDLDLRWNHMDKHAEQRKGIHCELDLTLFS